jgi:hypothetical protein
MDGEPTRRELYDVMRNLRSALTGLDSRVHEFDEDFQSFRVEVNRRFDRIDATLGEVKRRLETLEAAWLP